MSHPHDRYPAPPPYGGWSPVPPGVWPAAPAPRRNRAAVAWTVAGVLLAVGLLAVITVGGFRLGSTEFANLPAPPTSPAADWAGLGDDEGLDAYAQRCHGGDMDACDDLYSLAEPGSDYEYYALTCGGRVNARDVMLCAFLG